GNESTTLESLQFDFAKIEAATNRFAAENRIGKGGFGEVYKGILSDGQEIAVKRLTRSSVQGAVEFKNEVQVIAKLQHRNLVRLLGFCLEDEEKILIYDGYISPEYAMHGYFSVKSDVYSFGIMVLEIISGKRKGCSSELERVDDIRRYAWTKWADQTPLELMDPNIEGSYSQEEVIKYIHIGLLCVQENPDDRPTMATIAFYLNSPSINLPSPLEPPYFKRSGIEENMVSNNALDSNSISDSINGLSVTKFFPR
ncbi:cysteine-rich receptor-like protein kinase, partial [Trifolium pratense]